MIDDAYSIVYRVVRWTMGDGCARGSVRGVRDVCGRVDGARDTTEAMRNDAKCHWINGM